MTKDEWNFMAGSLSGFAVRMLTQPFDVLKIRFQLQVEPIRSTSNSYYSGVFQALKRIIQEEGVSALWKGHVPGQLLSVTFCGVQFATFYGLSQFSSDHGLFKASGGRDLFLGSLAGAAATTCCQPLDVMRTRLVAQGRQKVYSGLARGFQDLVRTEGWAALWRGLGPSLLLIVPQTSITFAVYEQLKRSFRTTSRSDGGDQPDDKLPKLFSLITGGLAGLCGKTAVYPFDLIKKRLEIRGFENARRTFGQAPTPYTSSSYKRVDSSAGRQTPNDRIQTKYFASWACLKDIVRHEGWLAAFKGWQPSAVKALVSTGLSFMFFEYFRDLFHPSH